MAWIFIIIGILFAVGGLLAYLFYYEKKPQTAEQRIKDITDNKISPDMGMVAAKKQAMVSEARTSLINQINLEADGYRTQAIREGEIKVTTSKNEADIATNVAVKEEMEARLDVIRNAREKGWDVQTYLDLEKSWAEAQNSLKGGFIFQMVGHQHLLLLTEYIHGLYGTARELEQQGKTREHALVEKHIAFMEKDFDGRQRLLQIADGQDTDGSDEDTNLR